MDVSVEKAMNQVVGEHSNVGAHRVSSSILSQPLSPLLVTPIENRTQGCRDMYAIGMGARDYL